MRVTCIHASLCVFVTARMNFVSQVRVGAESVWHVCQPVCSCEEYLAQGIFLCVSPQCTVSHHTGLALSTTTVSGQK